ncbi:ABC transporter permease [Thermaerobacter marianensis]|uniref:ABC transporter permease n=1 Tax=Thermaerobacter marianensis TaxID=73919 RepID=UPI0002F1EB5D|nr:ABC transporter permease subunit [Thermaerobacter marianensis]
MAGDVGGPKPGHELEAEPRVQPAAAGVTGVGGTGEGAAPAGVEPAPAGPGPGLARGLGRRQAALLAPTLLNPIIELEFRARMRRNRTMLLLMAYTAAVAAVFLLAVVFTGAAGTRILGPGPYEISWGLFQAVMLAELVLIGAVAGASGAGAISSERERQTWEILRTTRMPAWRIVTGKLVAAVALALWLVVASFPVFLPLFRFNAVQPDMLARLLLLFTASGLTWAALGLFFSALFRRTIVAVIATYGVAMGWVILTLIARPLQDALTPPPPMGPMPPRPVGPLAIELASPVLALLYALRSPLLEEWNWLAGGVVSVLLRAGMPAGTRITTAARVAAYLGEYGYYWMYVIIALGAAAVLAAAATALIQRREAG